MVIVYRTAPLTYALGLYHQRCGCEKTEAAVLTLTGLTKRFSGRLVLNGLDLAVAPGDSLALLGANGSGKTTTLRCVVGLARADSGRMTIAGIDAAQDPSRARRHLSYLPQKSAFPSTLTVRETLSVVAKLRDASPDAVDRELNACDLVKLADRGVAYLSGGEQQRLAIAVAFLPTVDLYLFDEPSAHLDPAASRVFFARAQQLRQQGRTLVFTTHIRADIRHLASRVAVLKGGGIESEGRGAFELHRYERLLEDDLWGDGDEDVFCGGGDRSAVVRHQLYGTDAVTGAGAARSR
jgi:ABC-type multidrug transport system ATPase subunit